MKYCLESACLFLSSCIFSMLEIHKLFPVIFPPCDFKVNIKARARLTTVVKTVIVSLVQNSLQSNQHYNKYERVEFLHPRKYPGGLL